MHRLLFAAVVLSMTALPSIALGQACTIVAETYVDADPRDEVVSPAIVLDASGDPCYVNLRILAVPGEPFDPYISSSYESFLQPLEGPPPYEKPFGCPYAPGDTADLKDQYDTWYPAKVTSSDRYCGYDVDYWMGTDLKQFGAIDADLRPPTLSPPSPEELATAMIAEEMAKVCPPGGRLADYPGDDFEAQLKRVVVAEIGQSLGKDTISVSFEKLLSGQTAVISEGSVYQSRNPDAALGATLRPYRLEVTVCVPGEPERTLSRFSLDYSCYDDVFGTFACRRDKSRPIP